MKNVYLDCGGHHGEGLREFIEKYKINDEWIVETFEPNPACNYINRISDIKLKNLIVNEKAVWIFDGEIMFSQENHIKSKSNSPSDGKSEIDGWGSVITELNSIHLKYTENPIVIPCIDFSSVLSKYPKKEFNVIVKMDIEGAEFDVLRYIIDKKTVHNISVLHIEWHDIDLENENINTRTILINKLLELGIKVFDWK